MDLTQPDIDRGDISISANLCVTTKIGSKLMHIATSMGRALNIDRWKHTVQVVGVNNARQFRIKHWSLFKTLKSSAFHIEVKIRSCPQFCEQ